MIDNDSKHTKSLEYTKKNIIQFFCQITTHTAYLNRL